MATNTGFYMLIITEISNAAERAEARAYLESQEGAAIAFGKQFTAGAVAKLGPVMTRKNYTGFEVRAISDGALVTLVVTIEPGMPESDVWCTWVMALQDAGLQVRTDAAYEEVCSQAAEWEAAEWEAGRLGYC